MTPTPAVAYTSIVVKRSGPPLEVHQTADLEEHVALIARQVKRSCDDPQTRQLAVKIVSGKPDHWVERDGKRWPVVDAWGESFLLPHVRCAARDSWCEIQAIWNFVVMNVRYVYDPPDYDLFCTVEHTLKAGGGDCLPHDTGLLVRPGSSGLGVRTTIAELVTRDGYAEIWDGAQWAKVTQRWTKGVLPVKRFALSNGRSFRCTDDHKLFVLVDGGGLMEVRARDVAVGARLAQPHNFGGREMLFEGPATVTAIEWDSVQPCFDIETETHRIWLPDANIVAHNCDDMTIVFAALLKCLGYSGIAARIITTTGESWEHVYALVALEKESPKTWVPLDATVEGAMPGWQYESPLDHRDFYL